MPDYEHLTDELAMDLGAGRVSDSDCRRIAAHLSTCKECSALAAFWQRAGEAGRRERTLDAPESAVRRAVALFDPALLPAPAWKRLLASFVFDSRRETALAGVRDAGASFQLLAQAEELEIDLLCEPEGEGWRITGQVLADSPVLRSFARLLRPAALETAISESGEFQLRGIPAGDALLEIETEALTVSLEPFRLGGHAD